VLQHQRTVYYKYGGHRGAGGGSGAPGWPSAGRHRGEWRDRGGPAHATADDGAEAHAADAGAGRRGGGHHEVQRGEGAGQRSAFVGARQQSRGATTRRGAVRAAGRGPQKQNVVEKYEDDDHHGCGGAHHRNHHSS